MAVELPLQGVGEVVIPELILQIPRVRDHAVYDPEFAIPDRGIARPAIHIQRLLLGICQMAYEKRA